MLSEEEMAINRLECGNTAHSRNVDYIQLAIKALKKQVPVKVVREHKKYKRHYTDKFYCPSCGCSALTDTGDSFIDYGLNYCDNCGQKLDWGDSN